MLNTATGKDEDSFAVEMKSKPGYSGSPTFVYGGPSTSLFHATPRAKSKMSFEFMLGVLWGQIVEKRPLRTKEGVEVAGPHVTEFSGLSGVVPAWHLLDLMEQPDVQQAINVLEEMQRKQVSTARTAIEPMAASSSSENGEDDHRARCRKELEAEGNTELLKAMDDSEADPRGQSD